MICRDDLTDMVVRFICALEEGRIVVVMFPPKGENKEMVFYTIEQRSGQYQFRSINDLISLADGGVVTCRDTIRVKGSGVDLVYLTLLNVCAKLKEKGYQLPKNYDILAKRYHLL